MKKFFVTFILSLFAITLFAQKDVTKFLGFPVDGPYNEMRQHLLNKGFRSDYDDGQEQFKGMFNGVKVEITVMTCGQNVCRVIVEDDDDMGEYGIKKRFNTLVGQFENNGNYTPAQQNQRLPEGERVWNEMMYNGKVYKAVFYQGKKADTNKMVWFRIDRDDDEFKIIMTYENGYNQNGNVGGYNQYDGGGNGSDL